MSEGSKRARSIACRAARTANSDEYSFGGRFAPLLDSSARRDPVVGGLDYFREILIRQNAFRV